MSRVLGGGGFNWLVDNKKMANLKCIWYVRSRDNRWIAATQSGNIQCFNWKYPYNLADYVPAETILVHYGSQAWAS